MAQFLRYVGEDGGRTARQLIDQVRSTLTALNGLAETR
jgi:hypothetical protein